MSGIEGNMQGTMPKAESRGLKHSEQVYKQLLLRDPKNAEILHAFGVMAFQHRKYEDSLGFLARAVEVDPQTPEFHNSVGIAYEVLGKIQQALFAYEKAISLQPDYAEAYHNMAIALQSQGDSEAAAKAATMAVQLRPDWAQAYNTLGYTLRILGRYDVAADNFRRAVLIKPDYAEAHNQLGVALDAIGRCEEALDSYDHALCCDPRYAEAHWNRSLVLLLTGRFTEGWQEYQWRRDPSLGMEIYPHHLDGPRWDGSTFVGKTLLVHYEQGFGDTLHFVRYLPMVKDRGGKLILEIREPLRGLLHDFPGVDECIDSSCKIKPKVEYDYHVSLMDLPGIFGTTAASIPANVPYIKADKSKVEYLRRRLHKTALKIGIVWSGSTSYFGNDLRSCGLDDFAPLAAIEGVVLYSLQKGEPASQIGQHRRSVPLEDLGQHFTDFSDTAAAIENMDLIISVDTSVLHLAGTMGKPVWALLCAAPKWRWQRDRTDNPWYPTMRLFRQGSLERWDEVFGCVADELRALVCSKREAVRPRPAFSPSHTGQSERSPHSVLPSNPDNAASLHILGLKVYAAGRYEQAIKLINSAISAEGDVAQYHNSLGLALEAIGRPEEALEAYRAAVGLQSDYAEAYNNMAIVLNSMGRYTEAVDKSTQAVLCSPDYAQAHNTLGYAHQMLGQYDQAVESYKQAIRLKPDLVEAFNHLGVVLFDQGHRDQAIKSYRLAINLEPEYAEAHNNLGVALREQGNLVEAAEQYRLAIQSEPDFAEARYNLANALRDWGHYDEAIENYRQAIRIKPDYTKAYYNLANTLHDSGRLCDSIDYYNRAIELDPDRAKAHWNLSLALLLNGQFTEGWMEHRWRRKLPASVGVYPHSYDQPLWDGSLFRGKRLLMYYEQGFGDNIQFIRYLPMVKARGGTVVLEVRKPLVALFHRSLAVDELVLASSEHKPNVEFDLHVSVVDLPAIFGTTLETIPVSVPYLSPDPCKVDYWRRRLSANEFKVGIVWGGSPKHRNDRHRSCGLAKFRPLADVCGVKLYGLQKGEQAMQADLLGGKMGLVNLGYEFSDFDDTAAVIENLDLVISVDTSVAHLAGAMGKPVWTLVSCISDWRWMLKRCDSPWYPTMRLFRQQKMDCWETVIEQIKYELQKLVSNHQCQ